MTGQQPHGQQPHGQQPHGQQPHGQQPHGQQHSLQPDGGAGEQRRERRELVAWLRVHLRDLARYFVVADEPGMPGTAQASWPGGPQGAAALAEIRAATLVTELASRTARAAVPVARAAGRSWDEIAQAWGIDHGPVHSMSRGRKAFERVARAPRCGPALLRFTCRACGHRVADFGPDYHRPDPDGQAGAGAGAGLHPRAQEAHHGDLCPRMAAAVAAWDAAHQPRPDHHPDHGPDDGLDGGPYGPGAGGGGW